MHNLSCFNKISYALKRFLNINFLTTAFTFFNCFMHNNRRMNFYKTDLVCTVVYT